MAIQIRRAERRKAKLRLALCGPTGAGKTYSALKLAFGLGGRVGMVDTEHGSGDLYSHLGEYDVISLEPPYTVPKYREAIAAFEEAGYDVVIVDSLSHAWAGEGGLLDKQGQLERQTDKYRNSYVTWREITPEHNRLVEELLGSPCHVIVTMRVKTEYVLEKNDRGKMVPRKIGLSPVQRDGVEYEFTVVMDVDDRHWARASKDRTSSLDGWYDQISEETGRRLKAWLDAGADAPPAPAPAPAATRPSAREWLARLQADLGAAATSGDLQHILAREDVREALARLRNGAANQLRAMIAEAEARTAPPGDDSWPGPPPDEVFAGREAA